MNILTAKNFYQELMNSTFFHKKQKAYITNLYNNSLNKYLEKKSEGMKKAKEKGTIGRPKLVCDMELFSKMIGYVNAGFFSNKQLIKLYGISRGTYFRIKKEVKPITISSQLKSLNDAEKKKAEKIFETYCYEYADRYVSRLWVERYREDMRQDCLLQMWEFAFVNIALGGDTKQFLNKCDEICQIVFRKYRSKLVKDKRVLSYDSYWNDEEDYNFLDKYIVNE